MSAAGDDVQRIAVVRANGLGDLVFSLPGLHALRTAYPAAEITLIGRPHHAQLLVGRPGSPVDRVEVAPPYGGVTAPEGTPQEGPQIEAFFARMQERRFDLALQLHGGGTNSNPFTRRLGARLTAGFRSSGAAPLDRWVRYTYFQHEVLRYLEAVALVGAGPPPSLEPTLTVTPAELEEADGVLTTGRRGRSLVDPAGPCELPPGAPVAVLNPGATDGRRRWPPSRFAAVGRSLADRGFDVVVSGDGDDSTLAADVAAQACGCCRSIAGTLSLPGLLGVLARARVVVSNDSRPLHLATAVGTPTVGVYWCGNALNGGPVCSHRHRPVISWRTRCPTCDVDCMTGQCDHEASFVADVPVASVLAEVDDLLDGRNRDVAEPDPASAGAGGGQ